MVYDSIIIGKGPAGIQAALYIKRANLNVMVIAKDGGALEKAEKIENFYGQEEPITGKKLVEKGEHQLNRLGITLLNDEVVGIQYNSDQTFTIKTTINTYITKTIVIATGANRKTPNIEGIEEFEGRGISYCAICDGFFFKDKQVVVLGNGDYAIEEAKILNQTASKVIILTNGKKVELKKFDGMEYITKEISKIEGNSKVERIVFKDSSVINVSGMFVAEGVATSIDFARKLGAETTENRLVVDSETMQTTIPRMFAAGDCTGELYQISKALYEGMKAGLSVIKSLKV